MKVTGHKTESIHKRYAIADSVAIKEGFDKLARLAASDAKTEAAQEA